MIPLRAFAHLHSTVRTILLINTLVWHSAHVIPKKLENYNISLPSIIQNLPSFISSVENCELFCCYRKQNSNITHYIECLGYVLQSNSVDMDLGDFNINYLNDNQVQPLKSLMESLDFCQLVKTPYIYFFGELIGPFVRKTRIVSTQ